MPNRLRRLSRMLPSVLVLALVFAAAAGMRAPQAPAAARSLPCDNAPLASSMDSQWPVAVGWGLSQPFDPTTNVQACSLRVDAWYDRDAFRILSWDGNANMPDSATVPLRYFIYDPSSLQYNHLRVDLGSRPVVTRRLGHLADPPRTRLALDLFAINSYTGGGLSAGYAQSGAAGTPPAGEYLGPNSLRAPLIGAHPVLSTGICAGDPPTQQLVLAQCVMTANAPVDSAWYEVYQSFRVPAAVTLRYVELAQDPPYVSIYVLPTGLLQVVEGTGGPATAPVALAQGAFGIVNELPQWTSHVDFDVAPSLVPSHDYGLLVRTLHGYHFRARARTGAESSDFTDGIGMLYGRTSAGGPWVPIPDRTLSLRMIGSPAGIVGAPSPPLAPGARLRLAVAPNPSRGAVFATWSGGSGRAHVEVLDARGRRVTGGAMPAAEQGRWLWSGAAADGRPAPPGLYFVRVRDEAGHSAVERVVVVR